MLKNIIQSKSKTFLAFCFCFLLGITTISVVDIKIDLVYFYISLFLVFACLIVWWKNKKVKFALLFLGVFIVGVSRYLIVFPRDSTGNIIHYYNEKVEINGFVAVDPDVRQDGVRYVVQSQEFGENSNKVNGKVYLKNELYPRYIYGDRLNIICELQKPKPIENAEGTSQGDFRYDLYLAKQGVFTICANPKIKKLEGSEGKYFLSLIYNFKNLIADKINLLWPEPKASFMAGLLYGYRGGLGELGDLFVKTGVSHIVAVSGYNISIIASVLIILFTQLYIPRQKAFWFVVGGILIFVILTGASPSVVRAGVMGVMVLLAKQVGRLSRPANLLALAAGVMCLFNPLILIWDAGFQLSFISTVGLIYLSPVIDKPLKSLPDMFGIKEILISTLSAIIATLPLILYQFGRLSIVAPIVNILILWLIPFLMLFGFIAVVLSFIYFPLGQVIAWIAGAGLGYIIEVVKWFGSLSFSAVDFNIPAWLMILAYVGMIIMVKKCNRSNVDITTK